jgi:hypothetical protein
VFKQSCTHARMHIFPPYLANSGSMCAPSPPVPPSPRPPPHHGVPQEVHEQVHHTRGHLRELDCTAVDGRNQHLGGGVAQYNRAQDSRAWHNTTGHRTAEQSTGAGQVDHQSVAHTPSSSAAHTAWSCRFVVGLHARLRLRRELVLWTAATLSCAMPHGLHTDHTTHQSASSAYTHDDPPSPAPR